MEVAIVWLVVLHLKNDYIEKFEDLLNHFFSTNN